MFRMGRLVVWLVFLFSSFMTFAYGSSYLQGTGLFELGGGSAPYSLYYDNVGIQVVNVAAFTSNLMILAGFIFEAILGSRRSIQVGKWLAVVCCIVMPWIEVACSRTFYFGEVGKPLLLVNNFGPIGSLLFASYAVVLWQSFRKREISDAFHA